MDQTHHVRCYGSRTMLRQMIAMTVAGLAIGCSTAPRVTLGDRIVLDQTTADASAGHVTVQVANTGTEPIELIEYTYQAHSGQQTYRGRAAGEMVLSAGMVRDVSIPVVLPATITPGRQVSIQGTVHYRGTTTWDETMAEWGWRPSVGFSGHPTIASGADARQADQASVD